MTTAAFVIALWGAVTGTVAVVIQITQHFLNRARLAVNASMSKTIDRVKPIARLHVEVEVSNLGRRPLSVEHVGIIIPNKRKPEPNVRNMRTAATLFDARTADGFLRLGEGDKHTFHYDFFPQKWARALYEQGKTARVFVRLTTGKEHFATYYLINPAEFPPETDQSAGNVIETHEQGR